MWGDPAFDDSTIRVVDALVERYAASGVAVDHDVIAGISAPQLLAARHRIPLDRIDVPLHITTGRRLVDEYDPSLGDVVVLLDGHLACAELAGRLPRPRALLGRLPRHARRAARARDGLPTSSTRCAACVPQARERHGWVTDTYLLRPPAGAPTRSGADRLPARRSALTDGVVTLRPVTAGDWEVVRDEHNDEESLRWDFDGQRLTDDDARRQAAAAGSGMASRSGGAVRHGRRRLR